MAKLLIALAAVIVLCLAFPGGAVSPAVYIGAVSLATFMAFGADKFFAVRGFRRIPEDTLLLMACFGGTPGAFAGQLVFRHKTRKPYFNRGLIVIFSAQLLIIAVCLFAVVLRRS